MAEGRAVNITVKVRCTNKNLIVGYVPPGGTGTAVDTVNATFQIIQSSINSLTTGSITFTYALADDAFQVGNYYDMTMVDGVAPTAAKTEPRTP